MNDEKWKKVSIQEQLRAFSIVKYNTKFGEKKNLTDCECFIIMTGMRAENYSANGNNTGWGTNNFLSAIEKTNKNVNVSVFLLDNDAPLEKQAELVARYINQLKKKTCCKKIHILGVSKCGTMTVALLKYLTELHLDKLNIMAYSAPYLGTVFASPVILYKKVDEVMGKARKKLVKKLIPDFKEIKPKTKREKNLESGLTDILKRKHRMVFSQSHMDYDISEVNGNGVPKQHRNRYDKKYLENMFEEKTLDMLRKVKFTNITTVCTDRTLKEVIVTRNLYGVMLYLSSKIIFDKEPSDGMVSLNSAKYIEKVCKENGINISTKTILDGHHDICSDVRIIEEIVQILEKEIGEK
ncbi:MAG: hypothetical protein J6A89_03325 [Clostridia bacterium]|nr:hypothetical protein [Clostridia bacterium]